ncbi:hypothetical protein KIV45_07050 [Janthinobacterium lividum]|nr:hypothetical protein KIV45_07050 [Janthinobacterium lividum]
MHKGGDYGVNVNEFAAFIQVGKGCRSTVPLMGRFLNQLKNFCLNKNRRYQIRSGYIFEECVREALEKQGFIVKNIRRIDRQEFDVIAVRNNIIFNVQCKNNFLDQTRIESERKVFARYNRRLDKYYERALEKERMRADLLCRELGLSEVRQFVISAFPIATKNPRILAFANISNFSTLATTLEV